MSTHLVVGAGPVGRAIARELVAAGHDVRLASRSGRGPDVPGASRVAVDATDPDALSALAHGSAVVYNALNPTQYHRWPIEWPPLWTSLTQAATRSGALLATVGNLYGYGRPDGPMTERTPLRPADEKGRIRAQMWQEALEAHQAGRFRALEVRGSDYLGAGAESAATIALADAVAGRPARLVGKPDVIHSWTYTGDVARLVVAAAADPSAHGRVWHVPSNPPCTQRELIEQVTRAAGVPAPKISPTPTWLLRTIGLFAKPIGAAAKVAYQFEVPFVIDDTAARQHFGLAPTAWDDVIAETAADLLAKAGRTARQADDHASGRH